MTLNYYDYSEPSNRMAVFREVEELKGIAMKETNAVYFLINLVNNVNFMGDFSRGFDENERLKALDKIINNEVTQKEIGLFLEHKKELKN